VKGTFKYKGYYQGVMSGNLNPPREKKGPRLGFVEVRKGKKLPEKSDQATLEL